MTFGMGVLGKNSIWLVADRRLTFKIGLYRDNAIKMITLQGEDGEALLAYAGLGLSGKGVEPSAWINDVLAGLPRAGIEFYLQKIAEAMEADLPRHLLSMHGPASHSIVAPALISGKPRFYGISLAVGANRKPILNLNRYEGQSRFACVGSGAPTPANVELWYRELLRLIEQFEKGRVEGSTVADFLAKVNADAAARDVSVSPDCIVIWRRNGGGHQYYNPAGRCSEERGVPTIAGGMDVAKIVRASMPLIEKQFEQWAETGTEPDPIDSDAMNEALRRAFSEPKRTL